MKIKIGQSALLDALNITGKVIRPDGGVLPILANYLIDVHADSILITGSNLETFISKPVTCETSQPGSFLVPSERFCGVVTYLPEQDLLIEVLEKTIQITANEGVYLIPFEDSKLYPKLRVESGEQFRADLSVFSNKVTFCCLQSATSPFFGVFVEPSIDGISLTGCNSAVLSSVNIKLDKSIGESFLIRQSTLNSLEPGIADISLSKNNISFTFLNGTVIKAVLLDMKYPDWKKIVPKNILIAKVDRAQIIGALKRVTQFSENLTSCVKIEIKDREVTILAYNNLSEKATETLSVSYSGPSLEIGVNGKLFIQSLEKIESANIEIEFKDEKTALVINKDNHLILLMPLKL